MGRTRVPRGTVLLAAVFFSFHATGEPTRPQSSLPASPAVSADTVTPVVSVDVWKDAKRSLPDVRERLRASGFRGVHLVGPAPFAISEHDSLPLMGFRIFSTTESFGIDFEGSAILVVVRPESNEVFAARAYSLREDYAFAPPATKPREAIVASQFAVDLRQRFPKLPWTPGTYLSTVLFEQQHSNRVRTHIVAAGEKASEEAPKPRGADATIALEVPAVIGSGERATTIIRGQLRQAVKKGRRAPTLPVALVIIGQKHQEPIIARRPVPLSAGKKAGTWEGSFEIDLGKLETGPLLEQTYFVWALSGEAFGGPYHMEVTGAAAPRLK